MLKMTASYLSNGLQRALTVFVYSRQADLYACCPRGVLALKGTGPMNWRKGSCEVIQKPLELKSPNHCCVPLYGVTASPLALQHIAYEAVTVDSGQEHRVRVEIEREKKKRVQPAQYSHARRDGAANRKPRSAALFRAAVQQPQRG